MTPAPAPPPPPRDRTLMLLGGAVLFYTCACCLVAIFVPQAKDLYTLLTGLLGGFSGALLLRLKG
jgi:hypothetical protein